MSPTYKIKLAKEAVEAGLGSCFRRVDALGIQPLHISLPQDLIDFTVSRKFTSNVYGGNSEATFPTLSPNKEALHPYRNFLYLNLDHNPYAPQRAGYPGLFYRTGSTIELKEYRLLIRVKPSIWMYLGQYEMVPSAPLSASEWNANGKKTKESWIKKVMADTGRVDIRSRIRLRKTLLREPMAEEVEACDGSGVSDSDVERAYALGEESMFGL
ncbi:hypothetical protein H0H93_013788 [Arthromyces matolae]|nr:hypothetical protein H0H93_013788 [Arthromyces matolae]